VELAQFIERSVHRQLSNKRREDSASFRFVPMFTLYRTVADSPFGSQITTGFFNKILSDMRKTGVIITQDGGRSLALSEEAWAVQEKYYAQRKQFETLAANLIERGVCAHFAHVGVLVRHAGVPFHSDIYLYDGPAEVNKELTVENRNLLAAITALTKVEKAVRP